MGECFSISTNPIQPEVKKAWVETDDDNEDNELNKSQEKIPSRPVYAIAPELLKISGYWEEKGVKGVNNSHIYNEDFSVIQEQQIWHEESWFDLQLRVSLYCIFDGHAGYENSYYCSKNYPILLRTLFSRLERHEILDSKIIEEIFISSFHFMDNIIKEEKIESGCCSLVAFFYDIYQLLATSDDAISFNKRYGPSLISSHLIIANAGDSRAVICSRKLNKIIPLSIEHTPKTDLTRLIFTTLSNPSLLGQKWFIPKEWIDDIVNPSRHSSICSSSSNVSQLVDEIQYCLESSVILFPPSPKLSKANLFHFKVPSYIKDSIPPIDPNDLIHIAEGSPIVFSLQDGHKLGKSTFISGTSKSAKILGTIGPTRGFGDFQISANDSIIGGYKTLKIKPFLSNSPCIYNLDLLDCYNNEIYGVNDIVILGSDGVWDMCSDSDCMKITEKVFQHNRSSQELFQLLSKELFVWSRLHKCCDDFSVIVCPLFHHLISSISSV